MLRVDLFLDAGNVLGVEQSTSGKPDHRPTVGLPLPVEAAQNVVGDAQQPRQRPPASRIEPRHAFDRSKERVRDEVSDVVRITQPGE